MKVKELQEALAKLPKDYEIVGLCGEIMGDWRTFEIEGVADITKPKDGWDGLVRLEMTINNPERGGY